MQARYLETPLGQLFAQVAGAHEPLFLIHGRDPRFNSWRTWAKNIQSLAEYATVYAFDLLGYGASDKLERPPDARDQAQALVYCIDTIQAGSVGLVGLSWGGAIAQAIVAQTPERINRLVLVDSAYDDSPQGLAGLDQIRVPTLITWDEDDTVIPVRGAHVLGQAIRNAKVRILTRAERDSDANPENRHWAQETHSAVWNRVVGEFLGRAS